MNAQVSQDFLYEYLKEHSVIISCIAKQMDISISVINSGFKHHLDNHGRPKNLPVKTIPRINAALHEIANQMRQCVLTFGSEQTFTNKWGRTYDPACVEPIKALDKFFNLTKMTKRVLGWSEDKKSGTICAPNSNRYGQVSADDVARLNAEILAVAGMLGGIEVVAGDSSSSD